MTREHHALRVSRPSTSKSAQKSDATQSFLFPGAHNRDHLVRTAIAHTIKMSRMKRPEIADKMSAALGVKVTVAMLDSFTANKHDHRFPLAWAEALCASTGDYSLLESVVASAGIKLREPGDEEWIEFGKAWFSRKSADNVIANLMHRLAGREP